MCEGVVPPADAGGFVRKGTAWKAVLLSPFYVWADQTPYSVIPFQKNPIQGGWKQDEGGRVISVGRW